jgi:hypothetical protein
MKKLKDAKMWDAIEQYSESLAAEARIEPADLSQIRRLRFLQHFHTCDYPAALQCANIDPCLVVLLFAELLPTCETKTLMTGIGVKNCDEFL